MGGCTTRTRLTQVAPPPLESSVSLTQIPALFRLPRLAKHTSGAASRQGRRPAWDGAEHMTGAEVEDGMKETWMAQAAWWRERKCMVPSV